MADTTKKTAGTTTAAAKEQSKTPAAPQTSEIPHEAMSLQQKIVELRKACPKIIKQKYSDGVDYKFAKIYDVWEAITPVMNEVGVNFDVVAEVPSKKDELGNAIYYTTIMAKTKYGERLMFLYEADLTVKWTNVDDPDDTDTVTLHAIGWNDDPAKAKGSAWTYCLKYYLFEKFSIDQGEDDPDANGFNSTGTPQNTPQGAKTGNRQPNTRPPQQNAPQGNTGAQKPLSDKQLERMYLKGEAAGISRELVNKRIAEKYHKQNPALMSRAEYDEVCAALDKAAAEGGTAHE
ncbi:MAG TPA: ERF family protein [Clostridiales bacterium]|nr:ERF family protein [Clostridiales bacterium]